MNMKLIETTCPNCGAKLKVNMERGLCFSLGNCIMKNILNTCQRAVELVVDPIQNVDQAVMYLTNSRVG